MDGSAVATVGILDGDGVGAEIMEATLRVLDAAGARIEARSLPWDPADPDPARRAAEAVPAVLKGPLRRGLPAGWMAALGIYCTIRRTTGPAFDLTVVRETAGGFFAGEASTPDADTACLAITVRRESVARYLGRALDWAESHGHARVTCVTKENALPATDGMVRRVFRELAVAHPALRTEHRLIDTAVADMVRAPRELDLMVAPDLYGDILGDVAASLAGSLAMVGSARIGTGVALFEPVHGPAPGIAGKRLANPSGLILSAAMMLGHLGQPATAARIRDAWMRTLEDGVHTFDMAGPETRRKVSGPAFTEAVIDRLGERPRTRKGVAA